MFQSHVQLNTKYTNLNINGSRHSETKPNAEKMLSYRRETALQGVL